MSTELAVEVRIRLARLFGALLLGEHKEVTAMPQFRDLQASVDAMQPPPSHVAEILSEVAEEALPCA